jgi:hypothetical protein
MRHLTKRGVVRDFITTITDQRELHNQLLEKGMIEPQGLKK